MQPTTPGMTKVGNTPVTRLVPPTPKPVATVGPGEVVNVLKTVTPTITKPHGVTEMAAEMTIPTSVTMGNLLQHLAVATQGVANPRPTTPMDVTVTTAAAIAVTDTISVTAPTPTFVTAKTERSRVPVARVDSNVSSLVM